MTAEAAIARPDFADAAGIDTVSAAIRLVC